MQKERYKIKEIEEAIYFTNDQGDYEIEVDEGEEKSADLSEALAALYSDCWDNLDFAADRIICYPADRRHNMRTGGYESTTVVISGKERHLEHLHNFYRRKGNDA